MSSGKDLVNTEDSSLIPQSHPCGALSANSLPSQPSKEHFFLTEEPLRTSNAKRKASQQQWFQGNFSEGKSAQLKMGDGALQEICDSGRILGQGDLEVVPEVAGDH